MSRIIVKNLPKNVTNDKIKDIFSEKGLVTDVQLKYTKDGLFRRFGFVGYKTEKEAQAAVLHFDKACIETCRISAEICAGLGEVSKSKSSSKKHSTEEDIEKIPKPKTKGKDNEADTKKKKKNKSQIETLLEKHQNDPLLKEFLEGHIGSGKEKQSWSNDISGANDKSKSFENDEDDNDVEEEEEEEEEEVSDDKDETGEKVKIAKEKISDLEYMKQLKKKTSGEAETVKCKTEGEEHGPLKFFTVKMHGLGYNHKKKHIKIFFRPLKPKSIRVPPKIKGIAYVGFKTEKLMKQALNKDKSFLDGKQILITKYNKKEAGAKKEENQKPNSKWKEQEEALKEEERIAESGRIFLRNLTYSVTEDDITKLFQTYGPLSEVNIPIDRDTRKSKGFGTVMFLMPEHAVKAFSELDGTAFNGRMLHLLPGKSKVTVADLLEQDGLSFKQKKELKAKAAAGSSHNWNTLFLGHDAVAETIASKYNMSKEQVLQDNAGNSSVAVRLALGETQVVQETQKFLEDNGVRLEAFNKPSKTRSKTVILVKNLPAETKVKEIREMFARHGEIARTLLPPSGITALVEFIEPSEARKAFVKLAYTKFKNLPLYLEWAPDNTFASPPTAEAHKKQFQNEGHAENEVKNEQETKEEESDEEDDEPEEDTTLFVKNLDFSTTEKELQKYFEKCGKLHYANIPMTLDKKNPGKKLSAGYGFVRYKLKAHADRALKELQLTTLQGKTLELKRSERTLQSDVKSTRKSTKETQQTGSKILVRNIPFQATIKEVTELFKAFGELKGVRLPKKLVGVEKHKGFGFVEYHTKKEAKRAFKALSQSTHLYGRRLVLEWAQAEEGVEEIRKRTVKHFHDDESSSKRFRKSVLGAETVGLEAD